MEQKRREAEQAEAMLAKQGQSLPDIQSERALRGQTLGEGLRGREVRRQVAGIQQEIGRRQALVGQFKKELGRFEGQIGISEQQIADVEKAKRILRGEDTLIGANKSVREMVEQGKFEQRAAVESFNKEIAKFETQGLTPLIRGGQVVGFEDRNVGMSYSIDQPIPIPENLIPKYESVGFEFQELSQPKFQNPVNLPNLFNSKSVQGLDLNQRKELAPMKVLPSVSAASDRDQFGAREVGPAKQQTFIGGAVSTIKERFGRMVGGQTPTELFRRAVGSKRDASQPLTKFARFASAVSDVAQVPLRVSEITAPVSQQLFLKSARVLKIPEGKYTRPSYDIILPQRVTIGGETKITVPEATGSRLQDVSRAVRLGGRVAPFAAPVLSTWSAYGLAAEGTEKALDRSLPRSQRIVGWAEATLGILGASSEAIAQTYRAAKTPFRVEVIGEPSTAFIAKGATQAERTFGQATRATVYPRYAYEIPAWQKVKAGFTTGKVSVPKLQFADLTTKELTIQPFLIQGEKAAGFSATRKIGRTTSLTKMQQVAEIQKPLPMVDFSKLPKEARYISRKLPPVVPEGTETFYSVGEVYEGVGRDVAPKVSVGRDIIFDVPSRLQRFSKKQVQLFFPTRRMTPEYVKSILNVRRFGALGDIEAFGIQAASKQTKGIRGIARGNVQKDVGIVFLKEAKSPIDIDYIGKLVKQITKQEQKQMVARIQSVIPTPKTKPIPTFPSPKVESILDLDMIPRAVGGLGKSVSGFAGKAQYELTDEKMQFLPGISAKSLLDIRPLTQQRQIAVPKQFDYISGTVGLAERGATKQKQVQDLIGLNKLRNLLSQPQPTRLKEKVVPKEAQLLSSILQQAQKQTQKSLLRRPAARAKPRPQPRSPRLTRTPPLIPFKLPSSTSQKISKAFGGSGFDIFIRRGGQDIRVATAPTEKQAAGNLAKLLKGSLAASGFVQTGKGQKVNVLDNLGWEFRPSKREPSRVVQRKQFRLGTGSEIFEIQAARRNTPKRSKKNRRLNWFK